MADSLEELKKRLYKKGESFERRMRRPGLTPDLEKAPPFWESREEMAKKRKPTTLRIYAAVIVAVFLGALWFYFSGGFGRVLSNNIELKIQAPETLDGGEKISWDVLVTNNNTKSLEDAELVFEYPSGAKVLDPKVKALRERRSLGRIAAGETVRTSFEAFLFGAEGEEKRATASLEYRSEDSNAILDKEAEFSTKISRSPVGVSFDLPPGLRAGQEIAFKVNYVSNAKDGLKDLVLELDYPFGFNFKEGRPQPEDDRRLWRIKSLAPGETGSILVKGVINGEDKEEKSFKARIGTPDASGALNIYGAGVRSVLIARPFLDVHVNLGGEKPYLARPGETLGGEVSFKNNLPVSVQNATVELFFSGAGLDERQIKIDDGSYRASTKSAVWNATSADILRNLNPGEGGSFHFRFAFLAEPPLRSSLDKNFQAVLVARITPGALPPGFSGADISGGDRADVKLVSALQLARRGFYFSSFLPNAGPLPPRVGQETTFAVVWSLINSTNDVDGLTVRAPLPSYVTWKGLWLPQEENISFNAATSEVLWKVGLLKAGTGFLRPAREIAFQIGFIPGANQVGFSPELMGRVTAEGRDLFVDQTLNVTAPALTMQLEDDPKIDLNQNRVAE
ncbi:MAG: hypothetical protein Q8R12_00970 [bacterium]|nr:hypothetical protein [bacterium]